MKLSVSVKSIMAVPGHKIRFPGPAPPYTTYLLRKKNIRRSKTDKGIKRQQLKLPINRTLLFWMAKLPQKL